MVAGAIRAGNRPNRGGRHEKVGGPFFSAGQAAAPSNPRSHPRQDKNLFRKNKTGFGQLSALEQPCFIWAASCLPEDEYSTWLSTVKPMFTTPTGGLFLKWAQQQRVKLIGKLDFALDDHQE